MSAAKSLDTYKISVDPKLKRPTNTPLLPANSFAPSYGKRERDDEGRLQRLVHQNSFPGLSRFVCAVMTEKEIGQKKNPFDVANV